MINIFKPKILKKYEIRDYPKQATIDTGFSMFKIYTIVGHYKDTWDLRGEVIVYSDKTFKIVDFFSQKLWWEGKCQ